jgi:cytoskeletal protein RodZ
MKRLRELTPDDHLVARAHELIDALGPTVPSEARMRRVRRALDQPLRRSRPVWVLRAALAFAVVGAGASALAFSGVFSGPAAPAARGPLTSPPKLRPATKAPTKASQPVEAPAERKVEPVPSSAHRVATRVRPNEPAVAPSVNASDIARVHEAAKALRADGDPERALRLLQASESVGGPLAEEALALRIEAASASQDPRAQSLAQSYLSRYPAGRYRELARRTLVAH